MYKTLNRININLIENGIINRFSIEKELCEVSFNGVTKVVKKNELASWLNKFFSLLRKYGVSPDGIYDRGNIAAIEIVDKNKLYDFVLGGRALELLNSLITKIM